MRRLDAPWRFADLLAALGRLHEQLSAGGNVEWTGPELTWHRLGGSIASLIYPERREQLAEQGLTDLDVVLTVTLQLGIEQGARMVYQDIAASSDVLDTLKDGVGEYCFSTYAMVHHEKIRRLVERVGDVFPRLQRGERLGK